MRRGLAAVLLASAVLAGTPSARAQPRRQAILVLLPPMSYEQALAHPVLKTLGRSGGLALLATPFDESETGRDSLDVIAPGGGPPGGLERALERAGRTLAHSADREADLVVLCCTPPRELRGLVESLPADEVLVIAAATHRTQAMAGRGDDALPIVLGMGAPGGLFPGCSTIVEAGGGLIEALPGCLAGLTSDTTRRAGLVSSVDVVPTILDFLRVPVPDEMAGSPIRREEAAPTALHRRYLEYRRAHNPAGLLLLAAVLLALALGLGLLFARRPPRALAGAAATLGLVAVAAAVVLLPASLLPRFEPVLLAAVAVGGALLLAALARRSGGADPVAPVAFLGTAGMLLVIADGALGWRALLMPLLGGSSLEGVRFYGLGNGFGGMLVAGAVLSASRLQPMAGVVLLAAAGFLAGLPGFGSNLGAGVTLFAAAGLWYGLRVRPGAVFVRVASAAGIAVVLIVSLVLVHRAAEMPTHVTRAVAGGDLWGTFVHRLSLNVRNTSATPAAWLIVALLPVWIAIAWRRLGPFGPPLRADPAWRDAAVTLGVAAVVGFLVNDTIGIAGMGFAFLSAALVYPALRWKTR